MDIVCVSDTHELHRELDVPTGDVLICAGDFTMFSRSVAAIRDFDQWLGELPHRHKLVIPGNHEFFLEADPGKRSLLSNATVLIDEAIEIDGLRIYGSPLTPLYGGAFGVSSADERTKRWARIPPAIDVLVTHGPPYGIMDSSLELPTPMGDSELLAAVQRIKPSLHIFGHVHGGYGQVVLGEARFVNAALMGSVGDLEQEPVMLRMSRRP